MPAMPLVWQCERRIRCHAVTTLAYIAGRGIRAGDTGLPTGILQLTFKITWLIIDRNPRMRFLSYVYWFLFQFCFSGAGLLQPELPGEISATRDRCDSRTGLCLDARGVSAAFVLLL